MSSWTKGLSRWFLGIEEETHRPLFGRELLHPEGSVLYRGWCLAAAGRDVLVLCGSVFCQPGCKSVQSDVIPVRHRTSNRVPLGFSGLTEMLRGFARGVLGMVLSSCWLLLLILGSGGVLWNVHVVAGWAFSSF